VINTCFLNPAYAALSPSVRHEFAQGFVDSCKIKTASMYPNITPDNIQYACLFSLNSIANEFDDKTLFLEVKAVTESPSEKIKFSKRYIHPCLSKAITRQTRKRLEIKYED